MIVWDKIDTVLLDMDGTLLDLHFDNYFWQCHLPEAYAIKHGLTRQEAENILFSLFASKQATLDWYCLDYWERQLSLDMVALKQEVQHLITIRPGALEFLRFLQEAGKRTILITNAHRDSLNLKMQRTQLEPFFNRLISAHDLGYPKEASAFWQALAMVEPFIAERTLFIDDTHYILDAAKNAGIATVLGIELPDSKGEMRDHHSHRMIRDFAELWL